VASVSGSEIIALAAVIVSGVGVVAGLGFNFWNSSSERKQRLKERTEDAREWYKRTLFERRVGAAQEAYMWIMRLNRWANVYLADKSDESSNTLRQTCLDAREWYDSKAVFLYDDLPTATEFIGLINSGAAVRQGQEQVGVFFGKVNATSKEVRARLESLMNDTQAVHDAR
jgi:hypothetical protein